MSIWIDQKYIGTLSVRLDKFVRKGDYTYNFRCPQLKTLNEEAKLSDIAKTITENYTTYYECAVRNDSWIEWYETQKIIFEKLNK